MQLVAEMYRNYFLQCESPITCFPMSSCAYVGPGRAACEINRNFEVEANSDLMCVYFAFDLHNC